MRRTHWSDKLRHRAWYQRIRKVFPQLQYTNHWLDTQFAGAETRNSGDRVKIFRLVELGQIPTLSEDGPAKVNVVARVEERIPGSAELLETEFWSIVKRPPGPQQTNCRLEAFLDANHLEQVEALEFDERYRIARLDERSKRSIAIRLSLKALTSSPKKLTFLALLVRQANFGGQLEALELARSFFDEQLEDFLFEYLDGALLSAEYPLILDAVLHATAGAGDMLRDHRLIAQTLAGRLPVPRLAEGDANSSESEP